MTHLHSPIKGKLVSISVKALVDRVCVCVCVCLCVCGCVCVCLQESKQASVCVCFSLLSCRIKGQAHRMTKWQHAMCVCLDLSWTTSGLHTPCHVVDLFYFFSLPMRHYGVLFIYASTSVCYMKYICTSNVKKTILNHISMKSMKSMIYV